MNYIINPWFFYFAGMLDGINVITVLLIIVSACLAIVFAGFKVISVTYLFDYGIDDDDFKKAKESANIFKKPAVITVSIAIILSVFVPSKETVYKMALARFATEDNVQTVVETIQNGADYIIDKVNEARK